MSLWTVTACRRGIPRPLWRALSRHGAGTKAPGLAIVVQLLGILAGSPPIPPELAGFGYIIIAMRPDLMGPAETFRENVSVFAKAVRSARPVAGSSPVRMPFDRSRLERARRLTEDAIEIPDILAGQLAKIVEES